MNEGSGVYCHFNGNGTAHANGLKNGIHGHTNGFHSNNGYSNGTNGHTQINPTNGSNHDLQKHHNHTNGLHNGTNGYHYKNGHCKSQNGNINNNNNYKPRHTIIPFLVGNVFNQTRRLSAWRLKIVTVLLMIVSHAFMTSVLSYKPAFQTVAPMAVTISTDVISTALAILCSLWYDCNMKGKMLKSHLYTYLCLRPKDSCVACATVILSPILDQLQLLAVRDVGTRSFKFVNHAGIIITLIACFYTFGRKPRPLQVWSIIIFVGCTQMMEYSGCAPHQDFSAPHKLVKFIWVTVGWSALVVRMVITNAYIVYLESFIRCDSKVSVWTRLIQIGFWKTTLDIIRMLEVDGSYIQENGFFSGFNTLVWIYILLRSLSVLLGFLCILYFDSVGKTLQQTAGILIGMEISSVLFSNHICLSILASCVTAVIAVAAYLHWNGHAKDLTKTKSEVLSPNSAWEIWYLDIMNGEIVTFGIYATVLYVCVWCLILVSVGEMIQTVLLQSMTPFLGVIFMNIMLCFRLRVTSSRFVYYSSVCVCVISLIAYVVLLIIRLDIHIYLTIM